MPRAKLRNNHPAGGIIKRRPFGDHNRAVRNLLADHFGLQSPIKKSNQERADDIILEIQDALGADETVKKLVDQAPRAKSRELELSRLLKASMAQAKLYETLSDDAREDLEIHGGALRGVQELAVSLPNDLNTLIVALQRTINRLRQEKSQGRSRSQVKRVRILLLKSVYEKHAIRPCRQGLIDFISEAHEYGKRSCPKSEEVMEIVSDSKGT